MTVLWAIMIYKILFCFTSSYKKTHETLSHAGQKATAAFSNVGTAISKKFGDMRYCGRELWLSKSGGRCLLPGLPNVFFFNWIKILCGR